MVVHDQNTMPHPDEDGYLAKAGELTSIGVRKVSFLDRIYFWAGGGGGGNFWFKAMFSHDSGVWLRYRNRAQTSKTIRFASVTLEQVTICRVICYNFLDSV